MYKISLAEGQGVVVKKDGAEFMELRVIRKKDKKVELGFDADENVKFELSSNYWRNNRDKKISEMTEQPDQKANVKVVKKENRLFGKRKNEILTIATRSMENVDINEEEG